MNESSTTPAYSGSPSSSTAAAPQQYIGTSPPQEPAVNESRFNTSDWAILAVGMILTGIIGYFSSLIAVKSDIAANRQSVSVINVKVDHINSDLSEVKDDLDALSEVVRVADILSVRVNIIEKTVEKNSSQHHGSNGITKQ
jgi:hypothetical protein